MKSFDSLKRNAIFRFFFPFRLQDNILSEMYAKVFKWTFISVFISAILIYVVFQQDGPIYDAFMQVVIKFGSTISSREYSYVENPEPKGILFGIAFFTGLHFTFKYMERIPEDVWDVGFKNLFKLLLVFIFLWILYPLAQRVPLEINQDNLSLKYIISYLLISYIHALMSINFCRVYLAVFASYGIRKTTRGPYLGDTDKNREN